MQDCTSPIKPYDHSSTSQHEIKGATRYSSFHLCFTFGGPKDESIRLWVATDTVMFEAVMITQEHGWSASVSVSAPRLLYLLHMYVANFNNLMDQITRKACAASERKNCACFAWAFSSASKLPQGKWPTRDRKDHQLKTKNIHKLVPDMVCKHYCASKPILSPTCSKNSPSWTSLR